MIFEDLSDTTSVKTPFTPDSLNSTVSPIKKLEVLSWTYSIIPEAEETFLTTSPIALLSNPINSSPTIKSWIVWDAPVKLFTATVGRTGSSVEFDWKTP